MNEKEKLELKEEIFNDLIEYNSRINEDLENIRNGIITIAAIAYKDSKKEMLERQKEQAILNYYQDVETLLDSLYIDCGDTILETDAGAKYLESKYTFDSLFINK